MTLVFDRPLPFPKRSYDQEFQYIVRSLQTGTFPALATAMQIDNQVEIESSFPETKMCYYHSKGDCNQSIITVTKTSDCYWYHDSYLLPSRAQLHSISQPKNDLLLAK